ncbi:CHAT domain-containing protein [Luteibacter sp. OK325]|uniref:TCAD7 domain-containing protein n=1 Tax=Luteibacter sp. OK325 TaxID=2135670 RepID=UPI000D39D11A|nr:TCAD7 domain-containing protein [Luteibacter sp. OK325]PTR33980.1 CHAT domain-containing protein [Luteibacter sp. OK325]
MLKPVISLDADMTAEAVLQRLAMNGFWISVDDPAASAYIAQLSIRTGRPVDDVATMLTRDASRYGAAIRRQWGARVLWYARELGEVLERCARSSGGQSLLDLLQLHESDASSTPSRESGSQAFPTSSVVMDAGEPVAVALVTGVSTQPRIRSPGIDPGEASPRSATTRSASSPVVAVSEVRDVPAWPRIDAPDFVPALERFDVTVGFGTAAQAGVAGGQLILRAPAGVASVEVVVELSAGPGVQAIDGWRGTMSVNLDDVASACVRFTLTGEERVDAWHPLLTTLEVRYLVGGTVCGIASRPLIILHSREAAPPQQDRVGESWSAPVRASAPVDLMPDPAAPDLTIEISKPDRNASSGQYVCQIFSLHPLTCGRGPFPMDLGQDAKTFAADLVTEVKAVGQSILLNQALESVGRLVAQCLPAAVFDALREVAVNVAPNAPAVLIVSAEPYVPWELSWVDQPLDATRPSYLGCQALVGRWLRDDKAAAPTAGITTSPRPATHPIASLSVCNMAVMAAWYKAASGFMRLPMAEAEASTLVTEHGALPLAATEQAMSSFLGASLEKGFERIGGVEAAHFAGHGDFDATRPDASTLFLESGMPIRSNLFRAARYGGAQQPLLFLNACMLGIGGELLGDMGGFPGNSLRGGFGGVLGALWEVDDEVARTVALEFWQRALPAGPTKGEPVGAILRDLRCRFASAAGSVPDSTWLAYVYYGHPRLTLERATTQ